MAKRIHVYYMGSVCKQNVRGKQEIIRGVGRAQHGRGLPDTLRVIVAVSLGAPVDARELERVELGKGTEQGGDLFVKLLGGDQNRIAGGESRLTGDGGWQRFWVDMTRR